MLSKKLSQEKAIDELIAIDMTRRELAECVRINDLQATADCYRRLVSLYAALDIHNVLVLIDKINFKKVS